MRTKPDHDRDQNQDDRFDDTRVIAPKRRHDASVRERQRGDALPPGFTAGAYDVLRRLGTGGCGTVYAAEHRVLGRKVALKVLHRHLAEVPQFALRFVQEARAVNLIRHPSIVDIYEFGALDDGRPFYVMELVDGTSLAALLQRAPLGALDALRILDPVCDALQAAHDKGVIHRDVKASNVLVVRSGAEWRVKLTDFGIAKVLHPDPGQRGITVTGQRLGTPHYMAPEQLRGDPVDARSDVYALGVLLFRMLTKTFPFHSRDLGEVERMHLETPPPPPSQRLPVAPALDAVVLRAMDKVPARRFESVAAFRAALQAAVGAPAARPAAPRVAHAVGIYTEVRVPSDDCELDDAILSDLAGMLDLTALVLADAGFALALETGAAILGARPAAPDALAEAVAQGLRVADELYASLAERPEPDPRIRLNVCVHVDRVCTEVAPDGKEFLAGPLVQIASWAPDADMPSLCVTEEVARALGGIPEATPAGRYLLVPPPAGGAAGGADA